MNMNRLAQSLMLTCGLLLLLWIGVATSVPVTTVVASSPAIVNPPAGASLQVPAVGPAQITEQVVLTPAKDNTLYEGTVDLKSNGAGAHFFVGKNASNLIYRGLVAFDFAGRVPPSSTIISATLKLYLSSTSTGTRPVALHRVLANWGEGTSNAPGGEANGAAATDGDATWVHTFFSNSQWNTLGGDFVATPSSTTQVGDSLGFYTWSSPALTSDVQSWVNNGALNFGWLLLSNEVDRSSAKRFGSRENENPTLRPELTIAYTAGAPQPNPFYLPLIQRNN